MQASRSFCSKMKSKRERANSVSFPETAEEFAPSLLESPAGKARLRLLRAGIQRFRGNLFNALVQRARADIGSEPTARAKELLEMAEYMMMHAAASDDARARGLLALGAAWQDEEEYGRAIKTYRKSLKCFRRTGMLGGEARVLARLGQSLAAVGKPEQAKKALRMALKQAQSMEDQALAAQISNTLGNAFRKTGQYRKARVQFVEVVEGARALRNKELESTALGNLGLTEFELGQYTQAESTLHLAIERAKEISNKKLEASHTGDLGNVYRAVGCFPESEACYRRALDLAYELSDFHYQELGLGDLGILMLQMGRVNEAIILLERARTLSESMAEMASAAEDTYHLSLAYRELGQETLEVDLLEESLQLAEAGGALMVKEGALGALANHAIKKGNYSNAEKYLLEADQVTSLIGDTYNSCNVPQARGFLKYQQGNFTEAEQFFNEAFNQARQANNIFGMLNALLNRGSALTMLGRFADAEAALQEALRRAQSIALADDERMIWEALGLTHELRLEYGAAQECYERALSLIESGRSALTVETHRIGFLAIRESPYFRLIQLLFLTRQPSSAWEICERVRSRSLVDMLAQADIPAPVSLPSLLVQQEHELLPILRLRSLDVTRGEARYARVAISEVTQLREKLEALWEEMASFAPEYVDQRRGVTLQWKDAKEVLS
jgi:tetratricopeptide (TPR) repeat protein